MSRFCAKVDTAAAETFTAEADAAASLKRKAAAQNEESKRARGLLYEDEARHKIAMDLAQLRYVKLVPGAHVDM
eukprot:4521097-Pleurochrysis_carterae.AAC.1